MNSIEDYYKQRSIIVIGELEKVIKRNNLKALMWVGYAIKNLSKAKGMPELLEQLAQIKITGVESKRQFKNSLTEIHAASFLSKTLGEVVLEVESRSNKVKSPYAKANKFCDIKTSAAGDEIYYEVKDAPSELTTSYHKNGVIHFEPMDYDEIEQWMKNKTKEADNCGANYLICRVPVWLEDARDIEEFYEVWIDRVMQKQFSIQRRENKQKIITKPNFSVSPYLRGIFILKAFGYIQVLFDIPSNKV